jgi:hypothetical protein
VHFSGREYAVVVGCFGLPQTKSVARFVAAEIASMGRGNRGRVALTFSQIGRGLSISAASLRRRAPILGAVAVTCFGAICIAWAADNVTTKIGKVTQPLVDAQFNSLDAALVPAAAK